MKSKILLILLLKIVLMGNVAVAADDNGDRRLSRLNFAVVSLPAIERQLVDYTEAEDHAAKIDVVDNDVKQDYVPALVVERYKKSALAGNAEAQFQLGLLYIDDELIEEDRGMGLFWIEQAAEQGHQQARIVIDILEMEDASFGC
jgi:TPR repeat protein